MAHELTTNQQGMIEFAYLRADGLPWHGLGQPMEGGESLDMWQAKAGMDWRVLRSKVRYATAADAPLIEMPDQHVLFRSDDKKPLGIVSEKYKVVQPKQMIGFFQDIAHAGGMELSAAGTIFGGRKFWATAKIGEASPTSVRDKIGGFILISSSADGSTATEVRRTTVRVVCSNTLAMAMADAKASVRVSHKSVFDPDDVKQFMGLNEAAWLAFRHNIVKMANVEVKKDHAEELTMILLGGDVSPDARVKVASSVAFNKILDLFGGEGKGSMLDGVHSTAWGWVNSVTEYLDHFSRARTNENRFNAAQWGIAADTKNSALKMALDLANSAA